MSIFSQTWASLATGRGHRWRHPPGYEGGYGNPSSSMVRPAIWVADNGRCRRHSPHFRGARASAIRQPLRVWAAEATIERRSKGQRCESFCACLFMMIISLFCIAKPEGSSKSARRLRYFLGFWAAGGDGRVVEERKMRLGIWVNLSKSVDMNRRLL